MNRELTVAQKEALGLDVGKKCHNHIGDGGPYYRPLTGAIFRKLREAQSKTVPDQ